MSRTLAEITTLLRAERQVLAARYGVSIVGVFGSYARGEQRQDSDIDILIELEENPRISLIGLLELEGYLSALLGANAHKAVRKNLRKRIGRRILDELVPI